MCAAEVYGRNSNARAKERNTAHANGKQTGIWEQHPAKADRSALRRLIAVPCEGLSQRPAKAYRSTPRRLIAVPAPSGCVPATKPVAYPLVRL
jgi:hypothetical protein